MEKYLPSISQFSAGATIYLADNASTDDSVLFVQNNYPEVHIIQNTTNGGFAKGYNDALKEVEADVFCLLNSDVEVSPDWLTPVRQLFLEQEDVAIIQPKILDLLKPDYFEYAGAAGGFIDALGYPFCRGRIFQALEKDLGQYDDTTEIFWATGACLFIRKPIFWDLGGFDEDYFAHQEEVDLCWRAKNRGLKIYYTGASKVFHLGGSTLSNMNPKKTYLNFRNSLFSLVKNLPLERILPVIFMRLILDGVAALRFLFQFRGRHSMAILRAHLSFYRNVLKMYSKRDSQESLKKYYLATSIVWSYFVHHKRNFNTLVKN